MGDSDQNKKPAAAAAVPAWQREASPETTTEPEQPTQQTDYHQQLHIAGRFLDADQVKSASPAKKAEFLKSKGISQEDIQKLLGQPDVDRQPSSQTDNPEPDSTQNTSTTSQSSIIPRVASAASDRPPIVTYPEFLVKPERPPPLVTKNGIFNTFYAFAGLSTVLYATSKYLIAPMVENLTDARTELHDVTYKRLDNLVAQLEKTVSVIPSAVAKRALSEENDGSDAGDPAEMFHRDIGTQTLLRIDQSATPAPKESEAAFKRHADTLTSLTKSLSILKDQFRAQSEGFEDVKTLLDVLRDDLDGMTYGGHTEFVGGYDIYGSAKRNEPEDEIRKVRDNIRRVKGVLLSTRNFPALTR